MKNNAAIVGAMSVVLLSLLSASAQETREQAVAGMRHVDPKEMDSTYTKPAPFAQKLVDEALANHPEVILIAIHAKPPGHKNVIVASNFGRIGKIGDWPGKPTRLERCGGKIRHDALEPRGRPAGERRFDQWPAPELRA